MNSAYPGKPLAASAVPGRADDRDDSSKTTPATDLQSDDAISPGLSGDLGADGTPAGRGQARGDRREPLPQDPDRREQGPSEAAARTAMKQSGRTGEGR